MRIACFDCSSVTFLAYGLEKEKMLNLSNSRHLKWR